MPVVLSILLPVSGDCSVPAARLCEWIIELEGLFDCCTLVHELKRAARIRGYIGDGEQPVRKSRATRAHRVDRTSLVLRPVSKTKLLISIFFCVPTVSLSSLIFSYAVISFYTI